MGFTKSVADFKGFRGIKPKYLTTAEESGFSKRYHPEETAITSFGKHTPLGCLKYHVLLTPWCGGKLRWIWIYQYSYKPVVSV
ncbi:MAG: hypothetical protein JRC68_03815 [Deltaproteobacteria bacterium]|nr:hypothetical protein [Deltaproteobacteria bacterium]